MIEIIAIACSGVALVLGAVSFIRSRRASLWSSRIAEREFFYHGPGRHGYVVRRGPGLKEQVIFYPNQLSETEWLRSTELPAPKGPGDKKREAFKQTGPRTFYYIDEVQVQDLYDQISEEVEPQTIETEEEQQSQAGVSANLKILSPKYDRGKKTHTKKTFEVKHTPAVMYSKIEEYLIEKGMITFGIEDFTYDESSIKEFSSMCDQMKNKFNFAVPVDLQNHFINDKKRGYAIERSKEVSNTSGLIAVQAEFTVIDEKENSRILSFAHPLNQFLGSEDKPLSIEITCACDHLSPSGSHTFVSNSSVKVSCLGKLIRWDDKKHGLSINPIAIF